MDRIKYPRTMNLPWSQSDSDDDVWLEDDEIFRGKEVVITEKLDGECTTFYPDGYMHARSRDYSAHPSRSWVKGLQAGLNIPEGWRFCGENLYAFHSIFYTELPSYFFLYGIYDENNFCIPWNQVEMIAIVEHLETVPILYKGLWEDRPEWVGKGTFPTYSATVDKNYSFPETFEPCEAEGYVVRLADGFDYEDFGKCCAKYVRKNHVQAGVKNWMTRPYIFPNHLRESE